MLALRWKNVNLDDQVLCVMQTVYDGHFDRPKTKRSVRALPLCRQAVSVLSALRGNGCEPEQLVFATQSRKPLCRRNLLQRHFATDVREAWPAANYVARPASLSRDVAGRCRGTARNGPGASGPRFTGDHEANLSARDSGGTTPCGRGSGEAFSWTQMPKLRKSREGRISK
jgi:hypothetical protein